jgi:hypothetical protein
MYKKKVELNNKEKKNALKKQQETHLKIKKKKLF